MGNQKQKSLEEVMNALSICGRHSKCCIGCPYQDISYPTRIGNTCKDVLHDDALWYLKNYRSDRQMYAENQKFWEDELKQKIKDFGDAKDRYIARLKELDIGTLNNPLSWEELKAMVGKPVWVEYNLHLSDKDARSRMWMIIQQIFPWKEDDELIYYRGFVFGKKEMGETWQAYRKERK